MTALPTWAYIVAGSIGAVAVLVGGYFGGRSVWRAFVRRHIVRLYGGSEGIAAARRTLGRVISDLAEAPDEQMMAFAQGLDDADFKALSDVNETMGALAYELNTIPLPKRLWGVGEELADVATLVSSQIEPIVEATNPVAVLDALQGLDVGHLATSHESAVGALRLVAQRYGMEEPSVYGGGLYI